MKTSISFALIFVLSIAGALGQEKSAGSSLVLPQIQVLPIQDSKESRQYELYIELPEGYAENPDKRYPVLYYTDATWHMEILSACQEYIFTEAILVGISWQTDIDEALLQEAGAHVSRYRDYTIRPHDKEEIQAKYHLGEAAKHLAFIRNDVIPFVEKSYRTDTENRTYFGYSAGGLFGTFILLSEPDTFKHYILGSPSLQGDIPTLTSIESKLTSDLNANVFISYGTQEEELGSHADQLIDLLKARKDQGLSLKMAKPEGTHQTAFPLTGVQGVTWLAGLLTEQKN